MKNNWFRSFFLNIILPSILGIVLFFISLFWFIIPVFEKNMMDRKKEMIHELTNTAWSILNEYDQAQKQGNLTTVEARERARHLVKQLRYGDDKKDYFWIINTEPDMVMHPYREELNGQNLTGYMDPTGKKLFVNAVQLVKEEGDGYINYFWQWKDDSTKVVPKLSYVKGFEPWHWIIGTGIYLEDVKQEIARIENRIIRISLVIILIIGIILFYIIRQSLFIENKRKKAEENLQLSRAKYKSLVEASTEGTLMIVDAKVIYSNFKACEMAGYNPGELLNKSFDDIFELTFSEMINSLPDTNKSLSIETRLKHINNFLKDVIISVSRVNHGENHGYIIVLKEVTTQKRIEHQGVKLAEELQESLLFMNQPILNHVTTPAKCDINTPVFKAASLMSRKKQKAILVTGKDSGVIGIVTDHDLRERVLSARLDSTRPVSVIMSSPVLSVSSNSLLHEAIIMIYDTGVSHLAVKNDQDEVIGLLNSENLLDLQKNITGHLIRQIEKAEDVNDMRKMYARTPFLVKSLLDAGSKTSNITRVNTSISDAITRRLIGLSMEELGPPPCDFAFIALGSEGRMEQTLDTDQDNAIIHEDVPETNSMEARDYFLKLGKMMNDGLNRVGYRFCKGEIMAGNEKWCQPLDSWKRYFSRWIHDADPTSLLEATIFFDLRWIHGSKPLVDVLKTYTRDILTGKSVFFYHLAQFVTRYKPPLNMFGNLVFSGEKEDNLLDIKKSLIPIIGFARTYALYKGVDQSNTLHRLEKLVQDGTISQSMYEEVCQAYNFMMSLRFRFQSEALLNNLIPGNKIDISKLTDLERISLKKILSGISELQTKMNFDFKGEA